MVVVTRRSQFIDEAYRLYDPSGRSYMQEAVDEIVTLLTEEEFSQRYPERVMATHVLWNPRLKRHMDARTGIMGKANCWPRHQNMINPVSTMPSKLRVEIGEARGESVRVSGLVR